VFSRILIANRGEIAVRVIRACRELGIETVAVYSDADAAARHVALADRAVHLGPSPAADSYLCIPRLLDAARATGAQGVHPGYGFLSESAAFAEACRAAGVAFIGPSAESIARMGSKVAARDLMQSRGVPVVPGETPSDDSLEALRQSTDRVGYPVLLKPSAGGGGIGMKVVRTSAELPTARDAARREARAAFGDETLYVERLIERARHIEIQILADTHGNVVHVGERECSLQRRHQKVVEESPSVVVTPALRARMGEAALAAARAVDYRNAGTIEFLLDESGGGTFYFLEMNTRLQVEHPVTEEVAGVDLVQAQIRIAAGEPLGREHLSRVPRGHAIECRVYAEDPEHDFLPQAGRILLYREPGGPGVRVDSGIAEGTEVPVHYDPLLAKVIVRAETRPEAIARMREALRSFVILGIRTNVPYLLRIVQHPSFERGEFDTRFLDRETGGMAAGLAAVAPPDAAFAAAAVGRGRRARTASTTDAGPAAPDPWEYLHGWRPGR
jgi:acetyl-CoA carboxylase biotin carboxylase subunit